jgi:hypothetical protein
MSSEHLLAVQSAHAFDAAPRHTDLHVYHVPFDELTGMTETEAVLKRALRNEERVAVIGSQGRGKSSVIAYVTGPLEEGIAPFRVPVFAEADDTVKESKAFAQHLIRTVTKYATDATLISAEEREELLRASSDRVQIPGREVVHARGVGGSVWLLKGDVAAEVRSVGEAVDHNRSAAQVIEAAAELLNVIGSHDLLPVVVLDDTDSWLNIAGSDKSPLVEAFFGRVIRMFSDFSCSLLVAVHEDYLAMAGYRAARGFLESTIRLPRLDEREGALARIFHHRVRVHGIEAPVAEIFDTGAMTALADYYRFVSGNLRKLVWIAHVALSHACADEADAITREYVEAGIAEAA